MVFGIEISNDDVQLFWKGYNDTLLAFVYESIQTIVELKNTGKQDLERLYVLAKGQLIEEWSSLVYAQPYK